LSEPAFVALAVRGSESGLSATALIEKVATVFSTGEAGYLQQACFYFAGEK
jgi:hypothetical protein